LCDRGDATLLRVGLAIVGLVLRVAVSCVANDARIYSSSYLCDRKVGFHAR
jgi:hypothetical protein